MDEKTRKAMVSSKNEHWNTPESVLLPLRSMGPVLLDPCSNSSSIVNARTAYDGVTADGLTLSWQCGGLVYVNPPYGRKLKLWVKKCVNEAAIARENNNNTEIVMLGPARTDTQVFQSSILPTAGSVLLWAGRITFLGAKAPSVFPSFLAYWGPNPAKFKIAFLGKGWFI